MIKQKELDADAKTYLLDIDNKTLPLYLFIASVHTEHIIYDNATQLVENRLYELFYFYDKDILNARQQFLKKLSSIDLPYNSKWVSLTYQTKSNLKSGTGVRVFL